MYPLIGISSSTEDKHSILHIDINRSSNKYTATNIHQINAALMEIEKELNLHIEPHYKDFSTSMERASEPTVREVETHVERMTTLLDSIPEEEDQALHQLINHIKSCTS